MNGSSLGPYDYYNALYNWHSGSEWLSGGVPLDGADVLFPATYPGAQQRQRIMAKELALRSLWFEAGIWYTIEGRSLTLGFKSGERDPYLLVVNSRDLRNTSEHTLEFEQFTIADAEHWTGAGRIENYSEGGLGIFAKQIDLNRQHIQIGGMGATHFNGRLTGDGIIDVGHSLQDCVEEASHLQPHFILQGDNRDWRGALRVNQRGFAIVKADQALGYGGEKRVYDGGSLALRSHVGSGLGYNAPVNNPNQPLQITGAGIIRREGTERIGALYNDGGRNALNMRVAFSGDTRFGARGDRGGGLFLGGRVYNTGVGDFIKVGPGLIALNNQATGAGANSWTGDTVIRGGVLRIGHTDALPSSSNIVFEGGVLELGYEGSGAGGVHNFTSSTGADELSWNGDGGFSAYGADRTVAIIINGSGALAALDWSPLPVSRLNPDYVLLLSSRYATHNITIANSIWTNPYGGVGKWNEIRVARGVGNAHAILAGSVTIRQRGFLKTGRGLLYVSDNGGAHGANNRLVAIEDGALRYRLYYYYNLQLAGGVLGIDANYARNLGTAHGEVQWTGSGGFAAYGGGTRSVTLNGGDTVFWYGTGPFANGNQELRFGHYTADGTVDFTNALDLGSSGAGGRTIRIERGGNSSRADVLFSSGLSGATPLYLVGDGRIDFSSAQGLGGSLNIYGAELRLHSAGTLISATSNSSVGSVTLRHGGRLYLDDLGKHDSETGGSGHANRIQDYAAITLAGGTLTYRRGTTAVEKVGTLTLEAGANSIQLFAPTTGGGVGELHASDLSRPATSHSTLHFSEAQSRLRLNTSASGHNVSIASGAGIIPWATAVMAGGWQGFATATTTGGIHYVQALAQTSYHTGAQNIWSSAHNVRMTANQTLGANRMVNSLVLGGGNLNLNGRTLWITSGGLITSGNGGRTISGASGYIGTTNNRPLYVHAFSNLTFSGGARLNFSSVADLVKTQAGTLTLGGNVMHNVRNVYIHGGTLDLSGGTLRVNNRITVGDGAGTDILKLAPDRWDQIIANSGRPNITLNGTPYDPRGPEYGGAQAILQMGGNTKLHLGNLHIENRGTIDWVGGEVGKANILWIESLTFSGPDAQLFMRNWYEYEDILLVRKTGFNASYLPQIIFEGYQNYETTYRQWDKDYWQITPFNHLEVEQCPEPSTYGAILGALGLALVVWRRRKQTKTPLRGGRWRGATCHSICDFARGATPPPPAQGKSPNSKVKKRLPGRRRLPSFAAR